MSPNPDGYEDTPEKLKRFEGEVEKIPEKMA